MLFGNNQASSKAGFMVEYTKDVADRVLRILQASGQVEEDKMTEIMVRAESRSARALGLLMEGLDDIHDPGVAPVPLIEEELVVNILSRAYALRRRISPLEMSRRKL